MEGKFSEDEILWIKEQLQEHGKYLTELLSEAIESGKLKKTGDLQSSLKYKVVSDGLNPVLEVSFLGYGRAIEIAWHKDSKNTAALKLSRKNLKLLRNKAIKKARRKDTRWYAKTVYGSINRLIGILLYEYGNEAKQRMQAIIENQSKLEL